MSEQEIMIDEFQALRRRDFAKLAMAGLLAAGTGSLALRQAAAREAEPGDDHGSGGHGQDDPVADDRGSGGHGQDDGPGDDRGGKRHGRRHDDRRRRRGRSRGRRGHR